MPQVSLAISFTTHACSTMFFLISTLILQASALATRRHQAPLHARDHPNAFPDKYIVTMRQYSTLSEHWQAIGVDLSNTTGFLHFNMFWQYSSVMDAATLGLVRSDPNVQFVETKHSLPLRPRLRNSTVANYDDPLEKRKYTSLFGKAPYHLAMISAAGKLSTPVQNYKEEYEYLFKAGEGVDIYIMDTGVRITHMQFDSRASILGGAKMTDKAAYCAGGETNEDVDDHGTRVAAVAAGNTLGVAPYANIISVKVICEISGWNNELIVAAFNAISEQHNENRNGILGWVFRGSIVNMSFGGFSDIFHPMWSVGQAVGWTRWYGVNIVGAANNENKNTAYDWPCYWSSVMCVGSVDQSYAKADFSGYGQEIDFIAPGVDILTAGAGSDSRRVYDSGCSFASPIVAGTAAIFTSWKNLETGGADGYVSSNSLSGLSSGWPWLTSSTRQWLVNTGIKSPKKYKNEPFRWATDNPTIFMQQDKVVPIMDQNAVVTDSPTLGPILAETYVPARADLPGDTAHYTEEGRVEFDAPVATAVVINEGLDNGFDHLVAQHAELSYGVAVPTQVLQDLGVTNLVKHPATSLPSSKPDSTPSGGQQLAIASYTNPLGDPSAWQRLISYDTGKLSILVANVLNGPDSTVDKSWASVIQQAHSSGKTIIGYVRTGYLGVSSQKFKTRLGSSDLADWASQIEQDVDKWFELYGDSLGGIFFDEGWPECGPNNIYSDLYARINAYTKRRRPGAYTVLNPGSPMAQCFEDTMDTLLTFESYYDYYIKSYTPNDWVPKDPRKIWHIIYRVPQDKIEQVVALARERHAGYVEVTDDDNPNPYDNVPSEAYMQAAISSVAGGQVRIDPAPALNGYYVSGTVFPKVTASDYTSITLTWSPAQDARGYGVYKNGVLILELPSTLNRATVGMLEPGTTGIKLEVRPLSNSDIMGPPLSVIASTTALPSDGAIANVQVTQDGTNAIYTADVLMPFAFVRLFIGGHRIATPQNGWPVPVHNNAFGVACYKVTNYLVEGNDFYSGFFKYTGAWYEQSGNNADWTWTPSGTAPLTQSGYTYRWVVPLGGTDAYADQYVIQGQGYAPLQSKYSGTCRYWAGGQVSDL